MHRDDAAREEKAISQGRRAFLRAGILSVLGALNAGRVLAADPSTVNFKQSKDKIDFLIGTELVGSYHIGESVAKPYFWPLNGPGGVPVTRAWPMVKGKEGETTDHVHQKSAWFCHGDVIPEGVEIKTKIKGVEGVDFWSEAPGHGVIVCTKVHEPKADKDHGQVTTLNEWRTADGVKLIDETRTLHLHALGDARLLVFDIDLQAAVPLTFGDTKEGSFGVRVNDDLREALEKGKKGTGRLENADGKTGEKEVWGQISNWCDYSGPLSGKTAGIAILSDPMNSLATCWHSRGYGLMAANPFGRDKSGFPAMKAKKELVKLAKGEHLKLRYGILLHAGDAKEGKVAETYQKFVRPKN